MNPMLFLNLMFQHAALNNYAKMLDAEHGRLFGDAAVDDDFSEEAVATYHRAEAAGEDPRVAYHPEHGWFVTHNFDFGDAEEDDDEEDEEDEVGLQRMVCWAQAGPEAHNKAACQWWKDQGANPDKYVEGVSTLHEGRDAFYQGTDGAVPVDTVN